MLAKEKRRVAVLSMRDAFQCLLKIDRRNKHICSILSKHMFSYISLMNDLEDYDDPGLIYYNGRYERKSSLCLGQQLCTKPTALQATALPEN